MYFGSYEIKFYSNFHLEWKQNRGQLVDTKERAAKEKKESTLSEEHISLMISDDDCDDISINRTGDLFEHSRLARGAHTHVCMYVCINSESYLISAHYYLLNQAFW